MASKAQLEMYGKKFDIDSVSWNFSRNLEPSGRTSGLVTGGEVQVSISSDSKDTSSILEDMMTEANQKGKDGKIVFYEAGDSTKEMKTVELKGAFVFNYSESYGAGSLMAISFSLSAHEVHFGSVVHKNHWPGDPA